MVITHLNRLSVEDRRARQEVCERAPLASHGEWVPPAGRPDPVALLELQNRTREPDLVPVRHGRMMVSPLTSYPRAPPKVIWRPTSRTLPGPGFDVQNSAAMRICPTSAGLASPERTLLFDLNDFDETLPGPFRVRRQAHGGELHDRARNNGFSAMPTPKATTLHRR